MAADRDPLLDPPAGVPDWLPTVDDERSMRWFRWVLVGVFAAGLGACLVQSADRPADPFLVAEDADGSDPAAEGDAGEHPLVAALGRVLVTLTAATGELKEFCLLHADEPAERSQGLMDVTEFRDFDGMLFSFDTDAQSPFFMFQTPTPLTITWWRADGSYVSGADMQPCVDTAADDCRRYPPAGPYRFAVEVPFGGYQGVPLDESTTIAVGGTCTG